MSCLDPMNLLGKFIWLFSSYFRLILDFRDSVFWIIDLFDLAVESHQLSGRSRLYHHWLSKMYAENLQPRDFLGKYGRICVCLDEIVYKARTKYSIGLMTSELEFLGGEIILNISRVVRLRWLCSIGFSCSWIESNKSNV